MTGKTHLQNTPTFHLEEKTPYYENASYTWSEDSIRYMNTVSPHARKNYLYMQECGYFQTAAPYYTERSDLPSYLILYTLSGRGQLLYEHTSHMLEAGSCFYIDCKNPHRYEPQKGQNWEFLWLHFQGICAEGYYTEFHSAGTPVVSVQDPFLTESTLRRILALNQRKTVYSEVLTSSLITGLVTELVIQKLTSSRTPFRLPDSVHDTVLFLQTHYPEPLSLDLISSHLNVSKYHLSREFSRCMGMSIHQYLISCRIQAAKELLRESSLSVEDIACQVGIGHVSHFIQLFRDREGSTPLEYRKMWKGR